MPIYAAELDGNTVIRVVVAPDLAWCETNLGGTWVATSDPYADDGDPVAYTGPGHRYATNLPDLFAPEWVQPVTADDAYALEQVVWHNGNLWRSTVDVNVWEPGISAWHDAPTGEGLPTWVQPTGAHDSYPAGFQVTHNGQDWQSDVDANVWEPGVSQWTQL